MEIVWSSSKYYSLAPGTVASAEYDPEPTVLKALWKDIKWFFNQFVGIPRRFIIVVLLISFGKSRFKGTVA
jgi:hypothetical protein